MIFLDFMDFYFYIKIENKLARMGSYYRAEGHKPRLRKVSERRKRYE